MAEAVCAGARAALGRGSPGGAGARWLFCFGNDAGDLDSVVSALGLAVWAGSAAGKQVLGGRDDGVEHCPVPVVSFPRKDFRLRGDQVKVFKDSGFRFDELGAPRELIFVDEVVAAAGGRLDPDLVRCGLTDHNRMTARTQAIFGEATDNVVAVVDHHADEGSGQGAPLRIIDESSGSACSLVAGLFLKHDVEIPQDLQGLLFATIMVDTRNFDQEHKRHNQEDKDVVAKLVAKYESSAVPGRAEEQKALYEGLMHARFDVSHLDAADMLRLDFKNASVSEGSFAGAVVGFCSIMDSFTGFAERADSSRDLDEAMGQFMDASGLTAVVCFAKSQKLDDLGKRKVLSIQSADPALSKAIASALRTEPAALPVALQNNPLFETQGILSHGFDLREVCERGVKDLVGPGTALYSVHRDITRKTLMPTVLTMLALK